MLMDSHSVQVPFEVDADEEVVSLFGCGGSSGVM
jgi:hypothetical protein